MEKRRRDVLFSRSGLLFPLSFRARGVVRNALLCFALTVIDIFTYTMLERRKEKEELRLFNFGGYRSSSNGVSCLSVVMTYFFPSQINKIKIQTSLTPLFVAMLFYLDDLGLGPFTQNAHMPHIVRDDLHFHLGFFDRKSSMATRTCMRYQGPPLHGATERLRGCQICLFAVHLGEKAYIHNSHL